MKVGIIVDNLRDSQRNFLLITSLNKFVQDSANDGIVFYQEPSIPCATVRFSQMQMIEAYSFDGTVIATSFPFAQKLLNFPGPSRKIYYVNELEWMRMEQPIHNELAFVFRHSNIEIVAANKEFANKLSSCWNIEKPRVVADFNVQEIVGIVESLELCPS